MACRYPDVYPKTLISGKGGKVYDESGNEYLDLISGLGAISVGYANPDIDNATYAQMRKGVLFSLPNPIEYEVAKKLTELVPGTDQWKFGLNGTDGTVMAVRAARAYTGRMKIMTVGYNGCADVFECRGTRTAGIPDVLKDFNTRAVYNDLSSFKDLYTKEYACVLMEPMIVDYPREGFLEFVRYMCSVTGTLLIFDEVVNGGRFEGFVSSHHFKVKPDMYVLGKGLANGLPLCAVGSTRSIMSTFERNDFFASGTFGGSCIGLATAYKTLEILIQKIPQMIAHGKAIQKAFNSMGLPNTEAKGYPTRLNFVFPTSEHKFLFWQEMCKQGVLVGYANFIKADNTDSDVARIIQAMFNSFKTMKDNWENPKSVLIGALPEEALKNRSN